MKSVALVEKKIEKKEKKKSSRKVNWRAKLWMFFFFLLAGQTSPKSRDFLLSVSAVGSAFDFCSSKFSLDIFVERAFFFFWSI